MKNISPITLFDRAAAWLTAGFAFSIALTAYLGIYARHMADDYCAHKFRGDFFAALWRNYLTTSDRYSNFALISLSESISPKSVPALPPIMLALWSFGCILLLIELIKVFNLPIRKAAVWALALCVVFFSLLMAPNLYQIVYWRASMAVHFAPLVFFTYFAVYLLRQSAKAGQTPLWQYAVNFMLAFLIGGFSEPTTVAFIAAGGLITLLLWGKPAMRISISAWIGFIAAILVMLSAPANSLRLGTPPPPLPVLFANSFLYAYQFALNTLNTLRLPALLVFLVPFLILYLQFQNQKADTRRLGLFFVIAPVLAYLFITASFAPSVYGQSFPVERARFTGLLSLVLGLAGMGASAGAALAQWKPATALWVQWAALGLMIILAVYPFRAAVQSYLGSEPLRTQAYWWDLRNDFILRQVHAGKRELIIPGLGGFMGVKEIDQRPDHWINNCAAAYYGLDSIRANSFRDPAEMLEYLSE